MRRILRFRFLAILSIVVSASVPAHAQWVEDGTPICTASGSQQPQEIIPDGLGGAILVWGDTRGADSDIYAQRVDRSGNVLWTVDGVAVCTAVGDQWFTPPIPDGTGGCFVVWADPRNGIPDIYAQRIDASGAAVWTANGVVVCSATDFQWEPRLVTDGSGGAIVVWQDWRNGVDYDIYAQRIDANGVGLWAADGIAISTQTNHQDGQRIVADGAGGAIIAWGDYRTGVDYDIYAQRVDASGTTLWGVEKNVVSTTGYQWTIEMTPDGAQGAILVWSDSRNGSADDIYAQRLDANGNAMWTYNGIPVVSTADNQSNHKIVGDGSGGVFVVWLDGGGVAGYDIYAQRVDNNGAVLWAADGLAVRTGQSEDSDMPSVVADGAGGIVVAWEDDRNAGYADIYAQRVDGIGTPLWQANGRQMSAGSDDEADSRLAAGDPGSVFVSWYDLIGQGGSDIYAQMIDVHLGNWGDVAGQIASAADVTADQGGKVLVKWDASRIDVFGDQSVTHYSVWRAVDGASAAAQNPGMRLVEISDIHADFSGPAWRVQATAAGSYYWEWVSNTGAQNFSGYASAVPTLHDSVTANPATHYFQVLTHSADPHVFWVSAPDSGYSVDNLAPASPQNVAGYYDNIAGTMSLWWSPNQDADLAVYHVYRGSGPDFVPSGANRIATVLDTVTSGHPFAPVPPWYFKFSAVDVHGNESVFAVLAPGDIETPTLVAGYSASWDGRAVEVSWTLADVEGSLGFDVHRKLANEADYRPIQVSVKASGDRYYFRDESVKRGGSYAYLVTVTDDGEQAASFEITASVPAAKLTLYQNYPNPFRPRTTIGYELPEAARVELTVYDVSGRKVATLVSGMKDAGYHEVPFEIGGSREAGNLVSGVYFYKLKAGKTTQVKKMTIIK